MSLANNTYEAMRLDALSYALRDAQETIGGPSKEHAINSLRHARRQIDETLARLEARS